MAAPIAEEAFDELLKGINTAPIWDDFVGTKIRAVLLAGISLSQRVPSRVDEEQLWAKAVGLATTRAGLHCRCGSHA